MIKNSEHAIENHGKRIRLFLAADNVASLNNTLQLLSEYHEFEIVDTALDGEDCLQKITLCRPDIVIAELALPKISGVKIAEYLSLERPEISTALLADQSNLGFYRSAMLAGAREFLITPVTGEELAFSLKRLFEIEKERRQRKRTSLNYDLKSEIKAKNKNGKIILVSGGKGGTGRSFISANLANIYAKSYPHRRVAVADFDLQFGDICAIYDLVPKKSLADLVPVADELDQATLNSVAVMTDNICLFASPTELERSELVSSHFTVKLLEACRRYYDLTIINTGALMTDIYLDLMEQSDYMMLVANPEVLSVKACAQIGRIYKKMGLPKEAIGFVLNKHADSRLLTPERIAERLNIKYITSIPNVPEEVSQMLNEGKLIIETDSAAFLAFPKLISALAARVGFSTAPT